MRIIPLRPEIGHGTARRRALLPLAALFLAAHGAAAGAATLRPYVVVNGDQVKLGDLFVGAEVDRDTVLFPAPAPGGKIVLNARWLHRVAQYYKLDWRSAGRTSRSVVERTSNPVDAAVVQKAIGVALRNQLSAEERFEVVLDNPALRIHLPVQMPARATVQAMNYDARTRRFAAVLVAPDGRPGSVQIRAAGRVLRIVSVPVLTRRVRPGDIIRKADIVEVPLRADTIGRDIVLETAALLGKSPRRTLHPDRPLRSRDVREPMLVNRGALVTMVFQSSNMMITAKGKAFGRGAKGETVRVRNSSSGKTVEAVIIGHNKVSVDPTGASLQR
jgi:flagella basal body P-ring formation protein FlgA